MTPTTFQAALAQQNINLTAQQMRQFDRYYQALITANQKMNLTAITSEADVYLKHFYDSLSLAMALPSLQKEALSLLDVGAGAGFPSLPVKIAFPQLQISIVDSLNKRLRFLRDLTEQLGVKPVRLYHARAEDFGRAKSVYREQYDVVCARAVANLPILAEYCLPLVKVGGVFAAMKGSKGEAELAETALDRLGGQVQQVLTFELPETQAQRQVLLIKKVKTTLLTYPRQPKTIRQKPLIKKSK